jgi:hypothetical protein
MHKTPLIRTTGILVCLIVLATVSFSQSASDSKPNPTPLKIIYTGKLLGYFRVPSRQPRDQFQGCHDRSADDSEAAKTFLDQIRGNLDGKNKQAADDNYKNAILVATGDNFAPQLEARVFAPQAKPGLDSSEPKSETYQPGNKELYSWYQAGPNSKWVPIQDQPEGLRKLLVRGEGTVPTDNVACFLAAAGFTAVVPGRHDFYFGAERVRQLARFMANTSGSGKPVQMLGANLIIKSIRLDGGSAAADATNAEWPDKLSVLNLQSVYPWFSFVQVRIMELSDKPLIEKLKSQLSQHQGPVTEAQFLEIVEKVRNVDNPESESLQTQVNAFRQDSVLIKPSQNDPNPRDVKENDRSFDERTVRLSGNAVIYNLALGPDEHKQLPLLSGGHKYDLCLDRQMTAGDPKSTKTYCQSFSVHAPLFSSPHPPPPGRVDPEPYVFLEDKNVAIFGVVDPDIGEQVGVLNFSWLNDDSNIKTVVKAEEPALALRQQLDYFEQKYKHDHSQSKFNGLKILLAQMSPQRARVLAARVTGFQVVVSDADEEQGTSRTVITTVSTPGNSAGTFVAVPLPYFDSKQGDDTEGFVHLGMVEASREKIGWNLRGTPEMLAEDKKDPGKAKEGPAEVKQKAPLSDPLWPAIKAAVSKCLPAHFEAGKSDQPRDLLKWLTLCAMRERVGADVALIQKRDFYNRLPAEAYEEDYQQKLDRLIWKGDLLTLMYVPGSALKKALEDSNRYNTEDSNLLSLAEQRLRGLEYLGITRGQNEYLINEVPLDDKKIYAVATTDYVGAGDTGYPALAAAALNPRRHPREFPESLEAISGLVCGRLFTGPSVVRQNCLNPLKRDDYLDVAEAKVAAAQQSSFGSKLRKLFPFKWPVADLQPRGTAQKVELRAQWHPVWTLSLKNFSLGFSSLNKNLTDAQVAQKFSGITTSSVTARQTRAVTVGLDTRLSRSSHKHEFFVNTGIDYKEQSTGDVAPSIVQINNRLSGDAGFIRSLRGGRSPNRLGIVFSLHAETPLQKPLATFTLGTQDRLKITQNRSLLVLPRIGMRWQNRSNYFEVGAQAGREINALSGYRFNTAGSIVECRPSATETFVACISRLSKPAVAAITKDSAATAILEGRRRAGLYWQSSLSIQFNAKVKYELTQAADFFFNFSRDNATDTRYRDISKHSLKFFVWPNFSIGPTLQVLLYQNKVNRDFLFQRQFGLEANVAFDLFNHREKGVQIKHKP